MIAGVKALGLETCATLGMLTADQARAAEGRRPDFYNHNLDTGPDYYDQVVTTRTYQERLDTLAAVRDAGISVCCGGIVGMGETAARPRRPASPAGHPAGASREPADQRPDADRGHAAGRLAAGRRAGVRAHDRGGPAGLPQVGGAPRRPAASTCRELQALCFLAGANSIFVGARLLTTANPEPAATKRCWPTWGCGRWAIGRLCDGLRRSGRRASSGAWASTPRIFAADTGLARWPSAACGHARGHVFGQAVGRDDVERRAAAGPCSASQPRIWRVASRPSITGIWMSISTASKAPADASTASARSRPSRVRCRRCRGSAPPPCG